MIYNTFKTRQKREKEKNEIQMKKTPDNIITLLLVKELDTDTMWGGFNTMVEAKSEVKRAMKETGRKITDYAIVREITIQDEIWRGSDAT